MCIRFYLEPNPLNKLCFPALFYRGGWGSKGEGVPLKSEVCTHPSLFGPLRGHLKKKKKSKIIKGHGDICICIGGENKRCLDTLW